MMNILRLIPRFRLAPGSRPKLFIDIFNEYIDLYLRENAVSDGTEKRYRSYRQNNAYFMATEKLQQLKIEEVRPRHAEAFRTWLKINLKTCCNRYASRHVELWKRVTKYAQRQEYIVNDPLTSVPSERDGKKKIICLEVHEVKKLKQYQFTSQIFRIAADLFLFQCFTGLSYADIWTHQISERNGRVWINGERAKSEEEYNAPLFSEALEILKKYEGNLPRLSNQKYNEYLKEIAQILNISKHLTTHVGRKTNATLLAQRGVSGKPISMILGNTEQVTNATYINHTSTIVENELIRLSIGETLLQA